MENSDPSSVENVINEFYKLKNTYEKENRLNKLKIINTKLSAKEKRSEFLKLKPKCINCKKPGGTIFSIKYHSEKDENRDYREFKSICNVIANPCNLNITVKVGKYELLPDILKEIENEIKDNKNSIIDTKNKLLFGFITTETALQEFDDIKDYVSGFTSLLESYLERYINITDNVDKKREINEDIERSYDFIRQIKECIVSFNKTDNNQYVHDAVKIYNVSLKPLFFKINNLKYNENSVFYDEEFNTYHLIQKKYSLKSLEYNGFTNEVVKNDVGLKVMKVAKVKPVIIDSSSISEPIVEPAPVAEPNIIDNIGSTIGSTIGSIIEAIVEPVPTIENGKVTWNNQSYQQFWDKFPTKLKNALITNEDWLKEFVTNCYNSRKNRTPCVFTSPKNLIIPPKQLNGQYDFGNKAYNDFFKVQSPSYKDTLLKLYSEKDGKRNYKMLEDAMNRILSQELDFDKGYI